MPGFSNISSTRPPASIRNPSVLGRCLRDITVGARHLLVEPMTLVDAAPTILAGYLPQA